MSTIPGFSKWDFPDDVFKFNVFSKGEGPGVILMHELPGLTSETVDFANYIAANGFHVVIPLLFGSPLQSAKIGMLKAPLICIRREFNCLRDGRSSPITAALRKLCANVHAQRGGKGVGAIGMCLTGGFVLSMMLEPALLAPVIAQPSLPFLDSCALDVYPETLAAAVQRSESVPVLGVRFEHDRISPKQRMDRLETAFGGKPSFERLEVPGKGHSTLTFQYSTALSRGIDTRQRVVEHLRRQLM